MAPAGASPKVACTAQDGLGSDASLSNDSATPMFDLVCVFASLQCASLSCYRMNCVQVCLDMVPIGMMS